MAQEALQEIQLLDDAFSARWRFRGLPLSADAIEIR
jgi:hypothetical protein